MLDEIVRESARKMLAAALRAEADGYVDALIGVVDGGWASEGGAQRLCRAAHDPVRGGGGRGPRARVNDKRVDEATGERKCFASAILPAWCRKSPMISEVLPLLFLQGLSTIDFGPALGQFLGSDAGLSASVITRLTETWKGEQRAFAARDLPEVDYVYLWADGIHVNIRLEEHKLCLLVLIGVRATGARNSSR